MHHSKSYQVAAGIAIVAALLLLWFQAAVATSDDSPGLIFFGVLVVGAIGAALARFRPRGMAVALVATAIAQALVAVLAMAAWKQYVEISIFNAFFIALWIGSALLFRKSAIGEPGMA